MREEYAVRLVVVSGVLLMADLFFAPWYDRGFVIGYEVTRTAVEPPQGWLALLAWLTTLALLIEVVVTRISTTGLPEVAVPWGPHPPVEAGAPVGFLRRQGPATPHYRVGGR